MLSCNRLSERRQEIYHELRSSLPPSSWENPEQPPVPSAGFAGDPSGASSGSGAFPMPQPALVDPAATMQQMQQMQMQQMQMQQMQQMQQILSAGQPQPIQPQPMPNPWLPSVGPVIPPAMLPIPTFPPLNPLNQTPGFNKAPAAVKSGPATKLEPGDESGADRPDSL